MNYSSSKFLNDTIFTLLHKKEEGLHHTKICKNVLKMKGWVYPEVSEKLVRNILSYDERFEESGDGIWCVRENFKSTALIDETYFTVVDIETTGGSSAHNRIIEIGAFKIYKGEIVGHFASLVNPQRTIPLQITYLTRIKNETVAEQPTAKDALPNFLDFIGSSVFVAHNAKFDFKFINAELKRNGYKKLTNSIVCTVKLSKKLYPQLVSHNLDSLISHFNIDIADERHRGTGDSWAAAQIFIILLDVLRTKNIIYLDDILSL